MRSPQSSYEWPDMNGLILGCSCSPVSSQIMLSSEKEFTAEKTLFQFDFGLASGLLLFLNGFTECSCTMIVAIDQIEAFKNDAWQVD